MNEGKGEHGRPQIVTTEAVVFDAVNVHDAEPPREARVGDNDVGPHAAERPGKVDAAYHDEVERERVALRHIRVVELVHEDEEDVE